MKKILNGKKCDTDTAIKLGSYMKDISEPNGYAETLYRTKSGAFFIHGTGNKMSPYASLSDSGELICGEQIRLVSADYAQKWAKANLGSDEYNNIFTTYKGSKQMCISVSSAAKTELDKLRASTGKSPSQIVSEAITYYSKHKLLDK